MAAALPFANRPSWVLAGACALAGHGALVSAALLVNAAHTPAHPVLAPVMVVELPEGMAPAPAQPSQVQPLATSQPLPAMTAPKLAVPVVNAPLPSNPVTLPPPQPVAYSAAPAAPQPITAPPAARSAPSAPSNARGSAGDGPGDNPASLNARNSWYAQISAHLERSKRYPREARSAGEQGTPSVRFSVDRRGRVSNVSIVNSSGHAVLDEATVSLMSRVSPLPPMPSAMQQASVTITLPIEYSLSRK